MEWVLLALLSAIVFSANSVLQKHTLERHVANLFVLGFWGGVFHLIPSLVILAVQPPPQWLSAPVLVMLGAGAINAAIMLTIYLVMQRESDISRIVPVIDAYPVFVVILAILFLGEALDPVKWLALGLVLGGVLLASLHQSLPGAPVRLNRSFLLLVLASFGIAVYTVLSKFAVDSLTVWQLYALSWLASGPLFLLGAHITRSWADVRSVATNPKAMSFIALTHVALFLAFITAFLAFAAGPASLASAVMATRPLLVLLWVMLMGLRLSEAWKAKESWRGLGAKGASALLVTVGVGAMVLP